MGLCEKQMIAFLSFLFFSFLFFFFFPHLLFQPGLVVSVMGLTRLLVNMPMAALGDTLGRKPLLVCGPIGTSLSMIGTG